MLEVLEDDTDTLKIQQMTLKCTNISTDIFLHDLYFTDSQTVNQSSRLILICEKVKRCVVCDSTAFLGWLETVFKDLFFS